MKTMQRQHIRRWCQTCDRFTRSEMDRYGEEICAEHREEPGPDWDDWDDWDEDE